MKWFIVPALAAAFVSVHTSYAIAQHGQPGQKATQHDSAAIAKSLNLTAEQNKQIRDIRVDFLKKILHTMHDEKSDAAAGQKLVGTALSKIDAVLTPVQREQIKANGGPYALLDMTAAHLELCAPLNLSKNQEAKVKKLIDGVQELKKAIYAEKIAPEEQHAKMKALVKETMVKLHAILTPEQIQKAHELMRGGDR